MFGREWIPIPYLALRHHWERDKRKKRDPTLQLPTKLECPPNRTYPESACFTSAQKRRHGGIATYCSHPTRPHLSSVRVGVGSKWNGSSGNPAFRNSNFYLPEAHPRFCCWCFIYPLFNAIVGESVVERKVLHPYVT